ncbi:MAG: MMPL family transporter, partial [Bacteroidia bacterium]|nr:MMPL family transporter [Bacteroidia bacterium]
MIKLFSVGFWETIARLILRNRILIIVALLLATYLLSTQWEKMRFTYTEANLLPDKHPVNIEYNRFIDTFGEEGNLIVIGIKDSSLFSVDNFNAWNRFSESFADFEAVETVISLNKIQKLVKNQKLQKFDMESIVPDSINSLQELNDLRYNLKTSYPFYDKFLYNSDSETVRTAIYLKKEIVNTPKRKDFILNEFKQTVNAFEKETGLDVRISGMPYIRTLNSQLIISEIGKFISVALLVTSLIFFFFFRSFRATFISVVVVIIGVMWTFGILGAFEYEITVLTALIPPVIIVIGIPNCIFLINKYQHEVRKHGN